MDYSWYVNNQLDTQETDREFTYTLTSMSVQIRAKVTQQGCEPISATVTLALPEPVECPQDIHIYERLLLYGVVIALVVFIIAIIFAATSCNRCSIFRALAWALMWAIIISGLTGTLGCPVSAVPIVSILAIIQGIVISAINRIEGCTVPGLFDFPFSFSKNAHSTAA